MKKTLKPFLSIFLLASLLFVLISCNSNKPELDFDIAQKNLEEAGYTVERSNNGDMHGIVDKIDASNGICSITLIEFESPKAAKLLYTFHKERIEAVLEYQKAALEYYQFLDDEYGGFEYEIRSTEAQIEIFEEEYECIGRSGKIVWYADSKEEIEATK